MGRLNKTGVRGLVRETVKDDKTGDEVERWSIDLRYRDADGHYQRYRERLPDGISAAAAKAKARKLNNAAAAGTLETSTTEAKTVGVAFGAYLEWAKINRPKSYRSKRVQSDNLIRILGRDTKINELSKWSIDKFKERRHAEVVAKIQGKGKEACETDGAISVNRALAVFKHAVKLFLGWKWMTQRAATDVLKVERMKEPAGRVRCLTPEEQDKILAGMPAGARRVMLASILSGLRRSECCLLRKDQVNLVTREITITKQKNGKVTPALPINNSMVELIEEALVGNTSAFVFLSSAGEPYEPDSITREFREAAQAAGVTDARFHDTRHTFATRLRRKGVQLDVLQDLGRWSSLTMVRRYGHIGKQELRDAVKLLDEPDRRIAQYSPTEEHASSENTRKLSLVK